MISSFRLFPESASTIAASVDQLYWFIAAVSVFFTVLVATLIIVFSIRYRRRKAPRERPGHEGVLGLELTWTIIPFAISMVMFVWGANLFITLREPPPDALQVFAVGKRWMWKVQHLEGRREINELHVPIGTPVKMTLTSEDVIHSFYIPAFRVKQDAVPGRYTEFWFEANKPGRYHLFCSEFCGSQHARMIGSVVAMEPAEYQAWLSGTDPGAPVQTMAEAGEELFAELGCASCHQDGDSGRGPTLVGLSGSVVEMSDGSRVLADAAYLRESILRPQARVRAGYQGIMPSFQGLVAEDQVLELIAYIESLTPAEPDGGGRGDPGPLPDLVDVDATGNESVASADEQEGET